MLLLDRYTIIGKHLIRYFLRHICYKDGRAQQK